MVLNEAGVKSFFQNVGIGIGNFNGKEKLPRSYKERKTGHYLYLSFFCVTWKNEGVSLLKATEKVKKKLNCKQLVLFTIMLMHMKIKIIFQQKKKVKYLM